MKSKKPLWISLASVFGLLGIVFTVAIPVTGKFESTLNSVIPGSKTFRFEKVEGAENEDLDYFKSKYSSREELANAEDLLCEKVEAEGAVLLTNKNNTLPLAKTTKFSCFSHSSVEPVFGGTGSGSVDSSKAVSLRSALENEFSDSAVNSKLWRFYSASCSDYSRVNASMTGGSSEQYMVNEVPWEKVDTAQKDNFANYGDVALVMISRSGGEGSDLPFNTCKDGINGNYLALTQNEIDMLVGLKQYKDAGVFKKIVVLLNYSNSVELDFLDDEKYGIDASLWIGDPGQTGMTAVAKLLSGTYAPSGKLADTFLKDNMSSPAMVNFGMHTFDNPNNYSIGWEQYNQMGGTGDQCNEKYHVYQEGIYVGYRYYETRYEDYVMDQGNTKTYDYHKDVAFPFGYSSSYTTFSYSDFNVSEKDNKYYVSINVTNDGNVAAKHGVEVYAQLPYTAYDIENGIEQSSTKLVGFTKTAEIAPKASEKVTIEVDKKDLATYDANKAKTYIMEEGTYYLTVGKDAHDSVNNFLAKKGYTPGTTSSRMDDAGNSSLVYSFNSHFDDKTFSKTEQTGKEITNLFDNADLNKYEGTKDQKITYVSRNNWNDTFPKQDVKLYISKQMWDDGLTNTKEGRYAIANKTIEEHYSHITEMPTLGSKETSLQLVTFKGIPYDQLKDNEEWNKLLDQATYNEIMGIMKNAFHITNPVPSIGLPGTQDENGPQGFTAAVTGGGAGMCYTSEDIMAATRNVDLLKDIGESIGEDFHYVNYEQGKGRYSGLYGPGVNIHRTPYCGRNFEYFSEDGILSSKLVEPEVKGIKSKGVAVFAKHFFLNDEENGRMGLSTWANEQSIREIYSRGFEGVANAEGGLMTSFGRLGVTWVGGSWNAIQGLYRNEWGCQEAIITDCSYFTGYMDYVFGVLAGVSLWDGGTNTSAFEDYQNNPAFVQLAKEGLGRIAYTYANSICMNGLSSNMRIVPVKPWWKHAINGLMIGNYVLCAGSLAMLALTIVKAKKAKEE